MRKLTILLALGAVTLTSGGCTRCCGRCRNLFYKGSPCGTTVAPAVLGAPLAMGTPYATPISMPMAAPVMQPPIVCVEQAPMCVQPCPPCDPCADPCASGGMSMGYGGDYMSSGMPGCECPGDGTMTVTPGTTLQGTTLQGTTEVVPGPGGE